MEGNDPELVTRQLDAWFNGLVTTQVQENIKLGGLYHQQQIAFRGLIAVFIAALAAIFALMPLALVFDQGSAMQQPLAVSIISGLLVQIPLVVIVMPLTYKLLARIKLNN